MSLTDQIFCVIGGAALLFGGMLLGEIKTRDRIYKDAYDNGMMTIEKKPDGGVVFRWRELHKDNYYEARY